MNDPDTQRNMISQSKNDSDALSIARREGWIYEDELPESITGEDYDYWFDKSLVIMGVRMGPPV